MHIAGLAREMFDGAAQWVVTNRRVPVSTYRLQFNHSFTFQDARKVVRYLDKLGITDCYASPYLKARPDSTHGYDICDHNSLNPAIGSERDYSAFVAELKAHAMGQVLDIVPNHMGIGDSSNVRWFDVLENGPSSPYSRFFDIDWKPLQPGVELEDKVLLPILGEPYGQALEDQRIRLAYEDGTFFVYYHDTKLPVAPKTQVDILRLRLDELVERLGPDNGHVLELQSIITALSYLPSRSETDPEKVAERQREKEVSRRRLANLYASCQAVKTTIDDAIIAYNGTKGDPRSFDLLDALLDQQAYRLAFWRVAAEEINFRRFFDINDLAAIRVEQPDVFNDTHRLVMRLLAEEKVTGLRIDHPDGLWDPAGYFHRLQRSYFVEMSLHRFCPVPLTSEDEEQSLREEVARLYEEEMNKNRGTPLARPLYVVAEKILQSDEALPEEWQVDGTTGYDFANAVNGLFVDRSNRKLFDDVYLGFTGVKVDFGNLVNSSKKMIMLVSLASEVNMLAYQLKRISSKNRQYRDFTLNLLTFAIREVIAALSIYRTYIVDHKASVDKRDRAAIIAAIAEAKRRNPRTAPSVFDFIGDILLLKYPGDITEEDRTERLNFVMKFQQTTGPVMAKGLEDTAFYVYNRLVSLNEVGGDPEQFGVTVSAFHAQNLERLRKWPHSMLTTSTHDSKRSEDVRARINVLSEIPKEWKSALTRWSKMNRRKKREVDGKEAPDRNEEYLLYQTLIGAWPFEQQDPESWSEFVERIKAYMLKATREAKVNTSWINPVADYDTAVQDFVRDVLTPARNGKFLQDFAAFHKKVAHFGVFNSLSQTLLKLTSPGVPDLYQGNEIWDFSLVDPDNRRPVDFGKRSEMLEGLRRRIRERGADLAALASGLVKTKEDGRIKLYVTHRTLIHRRENKELFSSGSYVPLEVAGGKKDHACAFARKYESQCVIVIVPRLVCKLTGGAMVAPQGFDVWEGTWVIIPADLGRTFRNVFTGETVETVKQAGNQVLMLGTAFSSFPLVLLEGL